MTAPKRIWLLPFDGEQRCWCDDPDPSGLGHGDEAQEYIRADLVAGDGGHGERIAELTAKLAVAVGAMQATVKRLAEIEATL